MKPFDKFLRNNKPLLPDEGRVDVGRVGDVVDVAVVEVGEREPDPTRQVPG